MNGEKTLAKKTIIYAVGNFGSKILAYVMVLVYTFYISPEELGYYDVVLTSILMLQPLVLFQINDGLFRYLVNAEEKERTKYIGNSISFVTICTIIAEIFFAIICGFWNIRFAIWIGALLASTLFFVLFQDVVRGIGKSKKYAALGIVNSCVMLLCEVIGLIVLKQGVVALIASKVIANVVCILIVCFWIPEVRKANAYRLQKNIIGPIIKYSAPLVPNTMCWWVVNSSDRYIIVAALGTAYNGIYSVATKFPTILTVITSVFYLAWQETAIKEYESENRDVLFSRIFEKYYVLLFSICICAIPATRFVIECFVAEEFVSAWRYTGFLYLGAVFSALCSFMGLGYQISKETSRSVMTTVLAAIINFMINIAGIKVIGLQAASLSTFLAYMFLMIIRIKHTKRYFTLKINWVKFGGLFIGAVMALVATMFLNNRLILIVTEIIALIILILANYPIIKPIVDDQKRRKMKEW